MADKELRLRCYRHQQDRAWPSVQFVSSKDPKQIWRTAVGTELPYNAMTDQHLRNSIDMLDRFGWTPWLRWPWMYLAYVRRFERKGEL